MIYSNEMIETITLIVTMLPFVLILYQGVKRCTQWHYVTGGMRIVTYLHTAIAAVLVLLGVVF